MRCLLSALLVIAILATPGCGNTPRSAAEPSDSPSSVPLVVAERSDWYLAIQGRPDKTTVLVTLINRNAPANFAYPPTEFRTLEVDPIAPIKAKGHLINEFIAEPVEIKKREGRSSIFRLENRVDVSDTPDGAYACRIYYDDGWTPGRDSKSQVGRVFSDSFSLIVRDHHVVGIGPVNNTGSEMWADILLANMALFDQSPDTAGFEEATWNPQTLNVFKFVFACLNLLPTAELRELVQRLDERSQLNAVTMPNNGRSRYFFEDQKKLYLLNRIVFELPNLAPSDSPTFWRLTYNNSPVGSVDYMYPFAYSEDGVIVLNAWTLSSEGTGVNLGPLPEFKYFEKTFERRGEIVIRDKDSTAGPGARLRDR